MRVPAEIMVVDPPWEYADRGETRHNSDGKCTFGLGAAGRYVTESVEKIASWPIGDLGSAQSLCFVWCTGPHIITGAAAGVLAAWGYTPATIFLVWIKMNVGRWRDAQEAVDAAMRQPPFPGYDPLAWLLEQQTLDDLVFPGAGHYSFSNAEYLVVGRRGKKLPRAIGSHGKECVPKQILFAPHPGGHSAKPPQAYDRIGRAWPASMYPNRVDVFGRVGRPGYLVLGDEAPGCKGEHIIQTIERLTR